MAVYKDNTNSTYYFKTATKKVQGKKVCLTRRGFKTKREALISQMRLKEQYEQGEPIISRSTDYLVTNFYEIYKQDKLLYASESTVVTNENKFRNLVLPYFEKRSIQSISINDVRQWKEALINDSNNYSASYLKRAYTIFNEMMKFAQKYGYILNNPVEVEGTFKFTKQNKREKRPEMNVLSFEEYKRFENALNDDVFKLLLSFLYYSGVRLGEALTLNFTDFSSDFSTVKISKSYSNKTVNGGFSISIPKTVSAYREVSLPEVMKERLKEHYNVYSNSLGFDAKSVYVFGYVKPLSTTQLERKKNKALKDAGIDKHIRIHDLRHSHASLLIQQNVSILAISKRLGHSNVRTTLSTYAHLIEEEDNALLALNKLK